jgi:hypothetical protein
LLKAVADSQSYAEREGEAENGRSIMGTKNGSGFNNVVILVQKHVSISKAEKAGWV